MSILAPHCMNWDICPQYMQFSVEICVGPGIRAVVLPSWGSGNIAANFVKFNVEILVQAGSPKIAFPVLLS